MTFTVTNALIPQIITVSAFDDSTYEGLEVAGISHLVTSEDLFFHGFQVAGLSVTILDNDLPKLFINEVDSDTPGADALEFVELYDGGIGEFSLDGIALVFFNGNLATPYAAFDLDGATTDEDGFFVIGNLSVPGVDRVFPNGTLQNGPDAVALYRGNPSDIGSVTTFGLLDALVYDTGDPNAPALLPLLLPGEPQVDENASGTSATVSMSRMPDGGVPRATSGYLLRPPSPGERNSLPTGDFDTDGDFDCADVDDLVHRIVQSQANSTFDLVPDGILDNSDLETWLALAGNANLPSPAPYGFGDANLDGAVDGSDFGIWNANKFTRTPAWCSGDFTADGSIDGSDFGIWNANKFTVSMRSTFQHPTHHLIQRRRSTPDDAMARIEFPATPSWTTYPATICPSHLSQGTNVGSVSGKPLRTETTYVPVAVAVKVNMALFPTEAEFE
jgi:hypothetical protein